MIITVLGASGRTGKLLVGAAVRDGHAVRAVSRRAGTILPRQAAARVGDATKLRDVIDAIEGSDAVVSLVGSPPWSSVPDDGGRVARLVTAACRQRGVRRAIFVTRALDVADALPDHGLCDGGLCWTVLRPARLGDGGSEGWAMVGRDLDIGTMDAIPRADLAELLLAACAQERWCRESVLVRAAHFDERPSALVVGKRGRPRSWSGAALAA